MSAAPHLPLPPAEHYALLEIVACSRLYAYAHCFRLDVPAEDGGRHPVAIGPVLRLAARGLVRLSRSRRVPGSLGFAEDTRAGLLLAARLGWHSVAREWNETPLDALDGGFEGRLGEVAPAVFRAALAIEARLS